VLDEMKSGQGVLHFAGAIQEAVIQILFGDGNFYLSLQVLSHKTALFRHSFKAISDMLCRYRFLSWISKSDRNGRSSMTIVFTEAPSEGSEKTHFARRDDILADAVRRFMSRPGANIMVVGVGGMGRNAIRNLRELGYNPSVELRVIDTQIGSDDDLYS